ncbi:hypothetical protein MPSEU_000814600 [Mayamaea pseudoterrestris]|nr:hypothetical protein MPSEU_000814600 [Mayamaea pseudoterrestris]
MPSNERQRETNEKACKERFQAYQFYNDADEEDSAYDANDTDDDDDDTLDNHMYDNYRYDYVNDKWLTNKPEPTIMDDQYDSFYEFVMEKQAEGKFQTPHDDDSDDDDYLYDDYNFDDHAYGHYEDEYCKKNFHFGGSLASTKIQRGNEDQQMTHKGDRQTTHKEETNNGRITHGDGTNNGQKTHEDSTKDQQTTHEDDTNDRQTTHEDSTKTLNTNLKERHTWATKTKSVQQRNKQTRQRIKQTKQRKRNKQRKRSKRKTTRFMQGGGMTMRQTTHTKLQNTQNKRRQAAVTQAKGSHDKHEAEEYQEHRPTFKPRVGVG